MQREDFYTEDEMCKLLNYKQTTLRKNRCIRKNHPPFMKLGNQIIYPKREYLRWVHSKAVERELKYAN